MIQQIIISSIILVALDFIFLYLNSRSYLSQVLAIQGSPLKINFRAAAFTYVILISAVNYFILFSHKSWKDAFLLGIVINGVFEGTTMTMFKKWKASTVFIDTLWGGVLFAATTFLTYAIIKSLTNK